jgi:hypothetical protein
VLLEAIQSLWEDITEGEGYAHRCEPKGHYRVRGERVVSFSDSRGREGMEFILSYLGAVPTHRAPDLQSKYCSCTSSQLAGGARSLISDKKIRRTVIV